ncbi:hypothetical protein AB4226_06540 [Vibrio artabrorum]|uniref:hypothetical protein n=1 Tax=Vibrio artabrorum TaxID=446374 RepID=UPI00355207A3
MKEVKYYYPIDKQTKEVLAPVNAEYRGGMYHIPKDALQSEPSPPKQGFVVVAILDESGKAIDSEYIEDYRGTTIYDESDCTKSEVVSELGPIKYGFTPDKPLTEFDERINNDWVTNEGNKYIADFNHVDDVRRSLYARICDPLIAESNMKRLIGDQQESQELEVQAIAARKKIQIENPWPTPPEHSS